MKSRPIDNHMKTFFNRTIVIEVNKNCYEVTVVGKTDNQSITCSIARNSVIDWSSILNIN